MMKTIVELHCIFYSCSFSTILATNRNLIQHTATVLQLTEDQIFALAPDDASKKSGRELASPGKWVSRGISPAALWGECQGSGSKPYQTQVDLGNIAFKCSCPSRKFPCKHGLGLMLLHARQPDLFTAHDMPTWVNDWISKRGEKAEKKAEQAEKPVDEAAQNKRQQAREQKVSDGVADLLVWIKDIVRNGILSMPEKNAAYWDNMARRMIDAQAGGLAALIRALGATNFWQEGWQSVFMDRLLQLYMIAQSYEHLGDINEDLQQDIRAIIGFTVNQDKLKQQTGVADTWLVLGKESVEEQQITVERNWLYGIKTGRSALILQFIPKGQFGQLTLSPGIYIEAELVFFPSAVPYRALIKNYKTVPQNTHALQPLPNWQQTAMAETTVTGKLPFRNEMPVVVAGLKPVQYQQQWWLQDTLGNLCRLPASFGRLWPLMALSGGEALTMAVIGREGEYKPLGVWHENIYKNI
jgi:uncharacterized Zn finger protein